MAQYKSIALGRMDNITSNLSSSYSICVQRYSRLISVYHSYENILAIFEIPDETEPMDKTFCFHITMDTGNMMFVPDGYSYISAIHRIDVQKPTLSAITTGGYGSPTGVSFNIDQAPMINTAYLVFGMEMPSVAEKRETTIDTLLEKEEPA